MTGVGNDLAFSMAFRAGPYSLHLPQHGVLYHTDLTGTVAVRTGFHLGAGFRAVAMAMLAGLIPVQGNFFLYTKGGFLKGQVQVKAQITAPLGTFISLAAPASAGAAEEHIENVLHAIAEAAGAKTAKPFKSAKAAGTSRAAVFKGRHAELVILGTLLFIRKDTVRFAAFLELFSGFRIILVQIRMVLACQLAICFFDIIGAGVFGDAKHLIKISFFSHCFIPSR